MTSEIRLNATVPRERSGSRFDQVAADLFPDYSRSRIQRWIRDGELTLNGRRVKPNAKLGGGEQLQLYAQVQLEDVWVEQDIPLDVRYEDEHLLVINKPAGLVVHPAAGNWDSTLLNGLIYRFPELRQVPRAGIVHRLDKDTSGLMVVARTITSQTRLVDQMQARTVKREYDAVAHGEIREPGAVDYPIGRHPSVRTKMAVVSHNGKEAKTHYEPKKVFNGFSQLRLRLETGRTHQIRVHMAHIGYPLIGDPVYGRSLSKEALSNRPGLASIAGFPRQALHAKKLGFIHPDNGSKQEFISELPPDFIQLIHQLEGRFT